MELNEMRRIAEAEETQKWGGWAFEEDDFDGFCIYINDGDNFGRSYVAKDMTQGESEGESTAEFIATFNPETVLALLSRLEQAEQAVQRVRELHERIPVVVNGRWEIDHCKFCYKQDFSSDDAVWPCPTIRALDGES